MRKYFSIVSMGRSGSTLLERLLASHPDITSLGEVISPYGKYGKNSSIPIRQFIEHEMFGERTGICGFKMPFDWMLTYPDVFGAFFDLKFKIIYLKRANKLDQFISMKLAQKTGVWESNANYKGARIVIKIEEIGKFFISANYADEVLRQMTSRFPKVEVTYEGLIAGDSHQDILNFLNASGHPLTTNTVRSRTMSRRDVIENFDDVAEAFSGTPHAWFFTAPE
ncbi:sulfotransferase [Azospirillum halopraeferens]|uniref:sulfotransferase n=1 Tax=Azospirillum halopraeferens TaxID=34010 RepID=UPI000A017F77|nr:sulfotransferase [Azospirillum halopraeferens]